MSKKRFGTKNDASYSCLPAFYRTGFASMYTVPKLIRTSSPRIPIRYESPELIQQFYHSKKLTTVTICLMSKFSYFNNLKRTMTWG